MQLANIVSVFFIILLASFLVYTVTHQVKEYHEQSDPMLHVLRELLIPVDPLFRHIRLYKGNKSYTINKERIYICLKDSNGEYYPMNQLVFVILHELAHMKNTKDVGHTEAWEKEFDKLLLIASEKGIYNPSIPILQNYCGHD